MSTERRMTLSGIGRARSYTIQNISSSNIYFRLIPMLMSSQSYGNILRLPCKKFADFRAIQKNHALEDGWVIRTIENTNLHDCRFECLRNRKCKSFNFRNDGSACELNSQSAEDQQDDVITVPRAGWTYHSTIYNDVLVGSKLKLSSVV